MERAVDKFIAYQKAREVSRLVTRLTRRWRGAKDLVDQALRAATSVTFNISEGTTRPWESADRQRYYRTAWGSAVELEAILDAAQDRDLGPPELLVEARSLISEVARIMTVIVHRPTRAP
jgi:four helix bundle protein